MVAVSAVVHKVKEAPLIGVFYAFGFAAGNIVGIKLETWLALGHIVLRVISRDHSKQMAHLIREAGFGVTVFVGEGKYGPVAELYIVCRRRDIKTILKIIKDIEQLAKIKVY